MTQGEDPAAARRKSRALVTALCLGGFAALMYAISIVKMAVAS